MSLFALAVFSLLGCAFSQNFQPDGELVYIAALFRHGARYTIYPQYYDGANQSNVQGELSPTGLRQLFTLGAAFRSEYIDQKKFLSPSFNSSQIHVYSSDVNRTMMSSYSFLQGLYPAYTGGYVSDNITEEFCLYPPFKDAEKTVLPASLGNKSLPMA